jgi:hypothetical protein
VHCCIRNFSPPEQNTDILFTSTVVSWLNVLHEFV